MGVPAPPVPSDAAIEEVIRERVLKGGDSSSVAADVGNVRGLLSLREIAQAPADERAGVTVERAIRRGTSS